MSSLTTITVLGAGYVGLTTGALLSQAGFKVFIVEPNPTRLGAIRQGKSFFYEHGLDPIIRAGIDAGTLIPTDSYEKSVPLSSVIFSCVGTPDNPDGSSNLSYVFSAAEQTAKYANPGSIYVQKSTVPVGTGQKIESLFTKLGKNIVYVSNPEFLREGTALSDTLFFDRVVVGGDDTSAVERVTKIYMDLEQVRDHIAHVAKIPLGPRGDQYIMTSLNSAELIKVTSNAFLALKISFANSIAVLADKSNADIVEVMDAVGADSRIGRAFLNAGRGYGGGCFPKDVSGLIASALEHGVSLEIMQSAQAVNSSMPGYIVDKLQDESGSLAGKQVAVLGLAFKSGTSDARRSPGVAIANLLTRAGAAVTVFDPKATQEAATELAAGIASAETIADAASQKDAIVIATDWDEILSYPAERYAGTMRGVTFMDATNRYDANSAESAGLRYIGIGHAKRS